MTGDISHPTKFAWLYGPHIAIIVYDATDMDTFDSFRQVVFVWLGAFEKCCSAGSTICFCCTAH